MVVTGRKSLFHCSEYAWCLFCLFFCFVFEIGSYSQSVLKVSVAKVNFELSILTGITDMDHHVCLESLFFNKFSVNARDADPDKELKFS